MGVGELIADRMGKGKTPAPAEEADDTGGQEAALSAMDDFITALKSGKSGAALAAFKELQELAGE